MDPLWFLLPAAFVAGFIDSMVGGGGVITLPALIAAGVPPHAAIATNKVAGTGASSMATWQYARHGLLRKRLAWSLFPVAIAMGALGAAVVLRIPENAVLAMIATVIVAMVAYVLLRPRFGLDDRFEPPDTWTLAAFVSYVALVAFYDGILGPGTGTLLLFGIVAILGMRVLPAAAHGRVYNLGSNLGALGFFALAGPILWRVGLPMMAATMAGAYVGSRSGIKHGDRWVRPLFVAIAGLLLLHMLWR